MNLKKLTKKAPFAFVASFVIVILLTMSVSAASNINDAAYQINMSVFNNISTDDHLDNQHASFTLKTQPYIDGNFLNSSLTGVAIRDADGKDVVYMPPPTGSNVWSVYLPYTPAGVQDFQLYMSQENLNGRQVLMPGANGITYDFSNINIDNDDSWRFDVDELNIKNGWNNYQKIAVHSSEENYISDRIDADYISLGGNNIYYQQNDLKTNVIGVNNSTTGKVWYNEDTGIYYNFKNKTLYKSLNAIDWDILSNNSGWTDMEYNGSLFVAYQNNRAVRSSSVSYTYYQTVFYSTNGIDWIQRDITSGSKNNIGLFQANDNFVVLWWTKNDLMENATWYRDFTISAAHSSDGRNWTTVTVKTLRKVNENADGVQQDVKINVSASACENAVLLRVDAANSINLEATTWTSINNTVDNKNLIISFSEKYFIFENNLNYYYELNGKAVTKISNFAFVDTWNKSYVINDTLYVLGNKYLLSTIDGINWIVISESGPYLFLGPFNSYYLKTDLITLGKENVYYKTDLKSESYSIINEITGKLWYDNQSSTYYNYKNKTLYKSTDNINWTQLATDATWIDLCYVNGVFYTITVANRYVTIFKSIDGITFEQLQRLTITSSYYLLQNTPEFRVNGNNISISMALSGVSSTPLRSRYCIVIYSDDGGETWAFTNNVTLSSQSASTTSMSVSNDSFKLVYYGDNNNNVYIYRNGTWTKISNITYGFNNLFMINNLPILFYSNSNQAKIVNDDNTLQTVELPAIDTWNNIYQLDNKYYLLGETYIISTTDGINWTEEISDGPYLYIGEYTKYFDDGIDLNIGLKSYIEQNVSLNKNNGRYTLIINDATADYVDTAKNIYLTGSNKLFTSNLVNYLKTIEFSLNDASIFEWNYSGDGTLYDSTGNGNNATVTYNSTYSPNISITLSNFRPVNVNQNNEGSEEEEGGSTSMIEPDEASITVIDTDSENWNRIPVFKELAKDLKNSDWPVDLVLSLVVVLIDMLLCFLIYRFTRNQLTSGIVALVLLGYFVIMGCIPLFALVTGIVAELAIMTKRKVISY